MFRRLISAAALVACAGIYAFAATERATFILTSGERKSGPVVFHGSQNENLINGYLNLGVDGGKDMTFPMDQVAVIDFVGGTPPVTELAQLATRHTLVLRNGAAQGGRFVNMIGGDTLLWDNEGGQRQQYAIRDVSRVYLNPQSARIAFNYTAPPPAAAAAAQAPPTASGITVRVDSQEPWTDTGLTVNQGDRVTFLANGRIQVRSGLTATPDGSAERATDQGGNRRGSRRDSRGYPSPGAPVGALLGQIGDGAPFGIGMQTQPLPMPASGRLMLGINDNDFSDNSGTFTVVVSGGRPDGRARQSGRDRSDRQDRLDRQERDRPDRPDRQDRDRDIRR
jgi:hypothetical protein